MSYMKSSIARSAPVISKHFLILYALFIPRITNVPSTRREEYVESRNSPGIPARLRHMGKGYVVMWPNSRRTYRRSGIRVVDNEHRERCARFRGFSSTDRSTARCHPMESFSMYFEYSSAALSVVLVLRHESIVKEEGPCCIFSDSTYFLLRTPSPSGLSEMISGVLSSLLR